jgi:hypothetical protein
VSRTRAQCAEARGCSRGTVEEDRPAGSAKEKEEREEEEQQQQQQQQQQKKKK